MSDKPNSPARSGEKRETSTAETLRRAMKQLSAAIRKSL